MTASVIDHNDAIRAPYLSNEELFALASDLKSQKTLILPGYKQFVLKQRLRINERGILEAFKSTMQASNNGEILTPAAEWLLDNHYLVEENIRQVGRALPPRFYRELPILDNVEGGPLPRIVALAWLYVAHTQSVVSEHSLTNFVQGFQTSDTLKIGELWALPSVLRYVLIENLHRISIRLQQSRKMRTRANELADRLAELTPDDMEMLPLLAHYFDDAGDNSFASQLLYRLRDGSTGAGQAITWLEKRLEARDSDSEEVLVAEHNRLSSGNVTIGSIVRSLRILDDIDWTLWFENVSAVDAILRSHSNFEDLDFHTRDSYRDRVERLARRSRYSETEIAQAAVNLAEQSSDHSDVGFYFLSLQKTKLERQIGYKRTWRELAFEGYSKLRWLGAALPMVLGTLIAVTAGLFVLASAPIPTSLLVLLLVLASFPAMEAANGLFHWTTSMLVTPTRFPGYEWKQGIPAEASTLVAVPCLLTNRDTVDDLVRNLEVHYLSNPRGEIYFALLGDLVDAATEEKADDADLLIYAQTQIDELAARYRHDGGRRFFLLHRKRQLNESEDAWIGWERKRGKLHELNFFLRGDKDTSFFPLEHALPDNIQYVMTLDADTRITRDVVTKLAGKMHHPVNRPKVDKRTGLVTSGYAILQPRVTPSLTTGADASFFQRVFSINRGLDPYVFAVSDTYQDLFDEGTFTGKGLYHVDAFESALANRVPDNAVLSHDLLEGILARAGLVTDAELIEDFPTRYQVEVSRQHRWVRGDWQLLPYILSTASGIGGLGRFKMIDNLRRSLTPIFWMIASVAGWCVLSVDIAWIWQAMLVLSLFIAPSLSLISEIVPSRKDLVPSVHFHSLVSDFSLATAQVLLRVTLIAHFAWVMGDAILRSLYRLFVSRKKLLEWRTAAQVERTASDSLLFYFQLMWMSPVAGFASTGFVLASGASLLSPVVLLSTAWIVAPVIAYLASRSFPTEDRLVVSDSDRANLRRIARRTWRYFETFVTIEHNYLPPDNVQETPFEVVAHRTSPTNIGLYLLSVVTARDFGWISFPKAIERIEETLCTLERMEKLQGHLFNWYDTGSLEPLYPRYISTVDSGNLAGHLITLASTCREWGHTPIVHRQTHVDGVIDVAGIAQEYLAAVPEGWRSLEPLRKRLHERLAGFQRIAQGMNAEPETASLRSGDLSTLAWDISRLASDLRSAHDVAETRQLEAWSLTLVETCEQRLVDRERSVNEALTSSDHLNKLAERARLLAFAMNFEFLYNRDRRLLSIGYRADLNELDDSCYDLLASEARLTSLFGIAKGDLPKEHWFRLGRPVVPVGFEAALLSWSGSMFEYLMPPLVMHERLGGILNQTNQLIVKRQIAYGNRRGIPWGISESAYNARDPQLTYQYSNFGVPSLGLKRGLSRDAVVAPYASLLASQYQPAAAVSNLDRLRSLGALGQYGFYDAVDFTPNRVPVGEKFEIVRNFMAHHHGMSIVAVDNVVFHGRMRNRFHADPTIEAAELLLQEKAPRDISVLSAKDDSRPRSDDTSDLHQLADRKIADPLNADRETIVLSNGHYSSILTATGAGGSRWNGLAVSRWTPDPTEDRLGLFIFLRDIEDGQWWSATAEPRRANGEITRVIFSEDKAEFHKTVGTLRSEVQCIVASEADAEARQVTLRNDGKTDRLIEVTSYSEIVLTSEDADSAHPLFAKMFVRTEIAPDNSVIHAWRNKRTPGEPDMHLAHLVTDSSDVNRPTQAETDRRNFIGRGRTLNRAAAFDPGKELSGSHGYTLDPIFALRRTVRVPAGKKVKVIFWTVAAPTREVAQEAVDRYRHAETYLHEAELSWTRSQVQFFHIGITSQDAAAFQQIARFLIYPDTGLRAQQETIRKGLTSQSSLWPLSISGDFPIFVLRIDDESDLKIVRRALLMQEYLRAHNLLCDLVVINERSTSYTQDLQQALDVMCENARARGHAKGPRQHIFTVRRDLTATEAYRGLLSVAAIVMHTRNGDITEQLDRVLQHQSETGTTSTPSNRPQLRGMIKPIPDGLGSDLTFWNGFGGFAEDHSYVVRLRAGGSTPHPWINVISNDSFGFHVSSEGAGFTWSYNSRDYQLTPWTNDPVINRPGEAFFVTDLNSGSVSTPFAALSEDSSANFEIRHAPGVSTFKSIDNRLELLLEQSVSLDKPVKLSRLTLTNRYDEPVNLRMYAYAEWVLGNNSVKSRPTILSSWDEKRGGLLATNPYSVDFAGRTAFLAADIRASSFTADRREFLGQSTGDVFFPSSVYSGADLSGNLAVTGDPCAALAIDIQLGPKESKTINVFFGDCEDRIQSESLLDQLQNGDIAAELAETLRYWRDFLDTLQVKTDDPSFDAMVNTWLPYQNYACRMKARSAFYQASGAFGFRDQLQDSLALMLHDPTIAREQVLIAAGRQFKEGDVQHWWLPGSGAGVRTMISDDVVWLGYAVAHYIEVTGDKAILDKQLPFLEGQKLKVGEHDAFFTPEASEQKASVYEHAARALDLAIKRTGKDGLPLILGGDWNDGMNRVGEGGEGQSVWLGWFLLRTLKHWIPFAEDRKDNKRLKVWQTHITALKKSIEGPGWDGEWYLRATYDDGTPLGSKACEEDRIDSLGQSWSVLSGAGRKSRRDMALDAVMGQLVDDEHKIVRLFTPPFQHTDKDPGYIKGYPPGVRENGGQYTHAATWVVYALAEQGRVDDAWRCFQMLNPVNHALNREAAEHYRVEPYAIAADIYGEGEKSGRGGWTWYTGSAGWLYRVAVEAILGIRKTGKTLHINPAIPSTWKGYSAHLRVDGKVLAIDVKQEKPGKLKIRINGKIIDETFDLSE
uniref:GH36-type glycosyl hydrolase domain-containing protein n=1 Tax=Pararhizobium sp. IMCC3301 TaxID=3067904 RepID=UPI002741811E|nr:glucoamylase family protein [Pararhizobium sp. IMCC3301]